MGGRHARGLLVLLSLTIGGLVVAACGGGDETRLSRARFDERANQECATLGVASESLRKAQEPGAEGAAVTKHLKAAATKLGVLVDELDDLAPPESIESDVDELVDVLRQYADGLETLGESAEDGQTFRDVLSANSDQVTKLNDLAQRSSNLVQALGLSGCMLEG
jgi:hypothetical protein